MRGGRDGKGETCKHSGKGLHRDCSRDYIGIVLPRFLEGLYRDYI